MAFREEITQLTTSTRNHADIFNGIYNELLENTKHNRESLKAIEERVDVLDDCNKKVNFVSVWENRYTEEIIFSTPIITTLSSGQMVIAFQSYDHHAYVVDFFTGEIVLKISFDERLYGKPVAEDINGDGKTEFIFCSYDGKIRCFTENGELIWEQVDEYTRQGSGTVSTYRAEGEWTCITDDTKNWCDKFGIRDSENPELNMTVNIVGGTGAGQSAQARWVEWNEIFFYEEFATPLDNTSEYVITTYSPSCHIFQHSGTLNKENEKWYLYITGFDMCCRKIDALTGEIIWVFSTQEAIEPFPLIIDLDDDGIKECYIVSVDWGFYCLDIETGKQKWVYWAEKGNDAFLNYLTLSNGKKVLIGSSRDGRVYYLNPDGTLHTRTSPTNHDIDSRPVVGDFNGDGKQEIVFGGDGGFVYCCDENGKTLWRHFNGVYLNSSAVKADINYDGKDEVLIGDMNGTILVFNPENGNLLDEIHFHGSVEGTPEIGDFDGDGNIEMVVTTSYGYVHLLRFLP